MKKLPIRPWLCLAPLCALPVVLRAEPPDLFQFRAAAGVEHDSNVQLSPSGAGEQADSIGIFAIGLKAEKRYGLQHFMADAEATAYRYRDLSRLDYSTLNYTAAWDWQFTPALHGVLSADRRQYRDITDTVEGGNQIGRRTQRNELLEGTYDIDGGWRAQAAALRTSSSTTVPESWDASPTVRSARVGAGYEFASGTTLFARYRRGDGEYKALPTSGPADFRENEAELTMRWPVSGKTSIDARVAHLERTHDGAPQRDFSGPVGSVNVNWDVTGKTRIAVGAAHDLSASGLDAGGHVAHNRVFIGPIWKATAATAVSLRYDRVERNWRDIPANDVQSGRQDVVQIASAGIDWDPRRWVTVSATVRGERLRSNFAGANYRNTALALAVKARF